MNYLDQPHIDEPKTPKALPERVRTLERSLRCQRRLIAGTGVLLLLSAASTAIIAKHVLSRPIANANVSEKIVTREIQLNDEAGNLRYSLHVGSDGALRQLFLDQKRELRMATTVKGNSVGNYIFDEDGHSQIVTGILGDSAYFMIREGTNQVRIALHSRVNGAAFLSIIDTNGVSSADLSTGFPHQLR